MQAGDSHRKGPNAKDDITHLPPEQLAASILEKEMRIAEAATSLKNWPQSACPIATGAVSIATRISSGATRNANDIDKLPTMTISGGDLAFSFKRKQTSIDGTTTAAIEVGTNLASWPLTYPVPTTAVATNPGVTVVKDSPTGFDTVTLTIPRAPDSLKFGRLKVTVVQ